MDESYLQEQTDNFNMWVTGKAEFYRIIERK